MTRRDIQNNASGGPAAQNAAARSHTSELTRGRFCFRVSTGGRHRWAARVQVGQEPARQKAREGYPSHYTSLVWSLLWVVPRGYFSRKMLCFQFKNSHCKDKTVSWVSYLYNGNSAKPGKMVLKRDRPLDVNNDGHDQTALQWCHISVKESQITGKSTVSSKAYPGWQQSSILPALCEQNPLVTQSFLHKGPAIQKAFPSHDIMIGSRKITPLVHHGCMIYINTLRLRQNGRHFPHDIF